MFGTIGALDSALWDIKAKAVGEPLWRLLGRRDRTLTAYASGLDIALNDDDLAALYASHAERERAPSRPERGCAYCFRNTGWDLVHMQPKSHPVSLADPAFGALATRFRSAGLERKISSSNLSAG